VELDRTGFTVEDRDRKQGLYFVRYVDKPEEKKDAGFFSRLFSSSPGAATPVRYRVRLTDAGNNTRISILNAAGEEDTSAVAQRIAQLLVDDLK
jgi:outer membrane protein assembly factor BamC